MDVLHFMKTNHERLREGFAKLEGAEGTLARRAILNDLALDIQVHLILERDYLYPELSGLFAGSETMIAGGQANAATIRTRLRHLEAHLDRAPAGDGEGDAVRSLEELKAAVIGHFNQEEQILMPKMRAVIRTEDREDLGQVLLDVKDEVRDAVVAGHFPLEAQEGRRRA